MNTDSEKYNGREETGSPEVSATGNASPFMQFMKYAIVGAMNTLLTLLVIYICKSYLEVNPYVSNAIGYFVGLINSFLWNRSWVFNAKDGKIHNQAIKFLVGFAICYVIQFFIVWILNQSQFGEIEVIVFGFTLTGYGIATLLGTVAYTVCNFIYNRLVAFR